MTKSMDTVTKEWFGAVSNGNIERILQLISDKVPVDTVNEVLLTVESRQ